MTYQGLAVVEKHLHSWQVRGHLSEHHVLETGLHDIM